MDFRTVMRRYGPTVHLTLAGELDVDTRSALDEAQASLCDGVVVVVCNMRSLSFIDVTGLRALLEFARRLDGRAIAFFAYNWQPQPRRLMDLIDALYPPAGMNGALRTHEDPAPWPAGIRRLVAVGCTASTRSGAGEIMASRKTAASRSH
ncbi:STAS domain-containing protein [Streptomyces sp. NPDC059378]|uniref:STAS domain-containing protein n=1 Tax=Streptomyces sp. NPDC059378 TaxID=3346815 RepID=UPI0036B3C776